MESTFLSRFTPSTMSQAALEAIFVKREPLAERIVELIRDSALTPTKHHTLLIGPRGIGKTHLVSLIYYRLRDMEDLRERLLIAWLREEEWGVASFLDLLLAILQALCNDRDTTLASEIEAIYQLPAEEAEAAAAALLKRYVGARTLLVVVENLDEVFRGLAEEGQQRWRSYLQENPFTTILATSQSLFAGISLRTAPFYGFFAIEHLEEFSLDDAIDLLTRIARYREDGALAALLQTPTGRDRVQAVQHLAGNNPRVYVILSQFINYTSLDELVEPVLRTLDDLTPFYQSRMLLLSPQQRKIVDLLCDDRHPVPVGEIAQRCFISHQTASGQLKTLREMGYVHPIGIGRESYYEIHEPLLRLCAEVKKQRGEPIRLFIEFLRLWYSRGEIEQRLTALALDATIERGYLLRALDVEDTRWLRGEEESGTPVREPGEVAETDDLDDVATWRDRGRNLERQGRYEEALAAYEQAIVLAPQDAANWRGKGRVALGRLGRYEEALAAYAKAVTLAPQDAANWYNKGVTLGFLGRYEEAVTAYDAALAAGAVFPKAFYCRALALFRLERWDEAVDALDGALGRYAEGDRDAGDLEVIFQHLLERSGAHIPWPSSIAEIVDVFDRHNALAVLGNALVRAIARLRAPDLDNEARDTWLRLWQEATRGHAEMQVPLRLLGAAVRFLNTNDRRALLELAIEERAIVQPLLGVEELPSRR